MSSKRLLRTILIFGLMIAGIVTVVSAETDQSHELFLPVILSPAPPTEACYIETGGVIIGETETTLLNGDWSLETAFEGYDGAGYLIWRGPFTGDPNLAVLRYHIDVTNPGVYKLLLRSHIDGDSSTDNNDVFIRIDDSPWTKTFTRRLYTWSWDTCQTDFACNQPMYYLSAGRHVFQIGARSDGMAVDRFALYQGSASIDGPASPTCIP